MASAPITVDAVPFTHQLSTKGATHQSADPDCISDGASVWYSYRAPTSRSLAATTIGSNYDTVLAVLRREVGGTRTLLACNDDGPSGSASIARLDAEAGKEYLFVVGSYNGRVGGNLVFNLDVAPPVPELLVTVDESGTFDEEGRASISGTVTCSSPVGEVSLELSLRQVVGRLAINGSGWIDMGTCASSHGWGATIEGDNGTFGEGQVTVVAEVSGCGDFDCVGSNWSGTVTLGSVDGSPPPPTTSNPPASPAP
jgi:hypothetical protein